jgi:hypothetical protein
LDAIVDSPAAALFAWVSTVSLESQSISCKSGKPHLEKCHQPLPTLLAPIIMASPTAKSLNHPDFDKKNKGKDVHTRNTPIGSQRKVTIDNILATVRDAPDLTEDWNKVLDAPQRTAMKAIATQKTRKKTSNRDGNIPSVQILHELAKREHDFPLHYRRFGEWLIRTAPYSKNLTMKDNGNSDFTPLHVALKNQNDEFVEIVLNRGPKEMLPEILKPADPTLHQENCLHLAIDEGSAHTVEIIKRCQGFEGIFMQGNNESQKDTPLHCAVTSSSENCDIVDHLIRACDKALRRPNKEGSTPYQYRIKWLLDDHSSDVVHHDDDNQDAYSDVVAIDSALGPNKGPTLTTRGTWDMAEHTSTDREQGSDLDGSDTVEAYAGGEGSPEFRQRVIEDPILSLIRDYCVRNFDRAQTAKALYHASQGGPWLFVCSTRLELNSLQSEKRTSTCLAGPICP